jgi:hypothetical protein
MKSFMVLVTTMILMLNISEVVFYPIFKDIETMNAYQNTTIKQEI